MPDPIKSGGGTLLGTLSDVTTEFLREYMEIIQGEERTLTFIVVANGRFDVAEAESIVVKIGDPKNNVVTKLEDGAIQRVCQELDVQVLRCTLTAEDTASLVPGLLRVEISFDSQKTAIHHSLKLIQQVG